MEECLKCFLPSLDIQHWYEGTLPAECSRECEAPHQCVCLRRHREPKNEERYIRDTAHKSACENMAIFFECVHQGMSERVSV